jgi:hypothetical protein
MWIKHRFTFVVMALLLILSACNLPKATPTPQNIILTIAVQTVDAQRTREALSQPPATFPPLATFTVAPASTATFTPAPTFTPTPICDLIAFIQDVSIPDGTIFLPGQTFTKTWRLKNLGICTWTTSYQLIFDSGDVLDGPVSQSLIGSVAPGQSVDLTVSLKAPANAGAYRGYWKLRNAAGVLIPVANGYQGTSFFVDIKVVLPTATPTLTLTPSPTITVTPTP